MEQKNAQDENDSLDGGHEPLLKISRSDMALFNTYKEIDENKSSNKCRILVIFLIVIIVILTILLIVIGIRCKNSSNDDPKHKQHTGHKQNGSLFFHISDTHLDLYYDKNTPNVNSKKQWLFCRKINSTQEGNADNVGLYGRIGCDSPRLLVQSAVNHMKTVYEERGKSVEFVLLTGDQSAHKYNKFIDDYKPSVIWSIGNNTKMISDALDIPIFPAIGNNDVLVDYEPPKEGYYKILSSIFEPVIFHEKVEKLNSKEEFRKTFEYGGYYKLVVHDGELVLVFLNTNNWSTKGYLHNVNVTEVGDTQMLWLDKQLSNASSNGQKVMIVGHIPPGCSTFLRKESPPYPTTWLQNYTDIFVKKTADTYAHIVTVQLYGHTHQDKIKLQDLNDDFPPKSSSKKSIALLCPSITPIFHVNPAFRLVEYDKTSKEVIDYTQYFADLSAANVYQKTVWQKEYSFQETYGKPITSKGLDELVDELLDVTVPTSLTYNSYMKVMSSFDDTRRFIEYCGSKHYKQDTFSKCIEFYKNVGK